MDKLIIRNQLQNDEENINFHFHANSFNKHTHDYFEIMLITEGDAIHFYNNEKHLTKKGDCWLIFPSTSHSLTINTAENSKHLNVAISVSQFRILCNAIDVSFMPSLTEKNNKPILIRLTQNEYNRIISLTYKFQALPRDNLLKRNGILNIIAFTLVQNFYLQNNHDNQDLPQFLQKIISNLSTIEYLESKPKDIIDSIHYSYSHFEKMFKKYIGISFVQYLNNRKLEYVKALLTTTDLSITTIANKVNMPSLGYFHSFFKNKTGLTPMQYRKHHKGISKTILNK